MRRRVMIDADAFNCLRSLGALDRVRGRTGFLLVMTDYIQKHDLNPLAELLTQMTTAGELLNEAVRANDPKFVQLRRDGVDRGEAEAIAWACSRPKSERPVFISNDRRAKETAFAEGIVVGDVLDLLVECVERAWLSEQEARQATEPWDDRRQERCRPKDWTGFATSWAQRLQRPPRWEG